MDADRFSGDASTTSFTLTRTVAYPTDIEVFVDNIQQEPVVAYTVSGTTLTFTGAPSSGSLNVYVVYKQSNINNLQVTLADGSVTHSKLANNLRLFTTDNLTPNGNNSVFTLSEAPADANTVFVTVDGIVQRAPAHYTTSGTTITFTSSPAANSNVHVRHLGFRTTLALTALAANSNISQPNIASPTITGTLAGASATLSGTLGVTGVSTFAAGTAAAPSLTTTGDTNTGIFFSAADTIDFTEGGTATGQFDSSGNFKFNSGFGSVATAYGCRAWVNFNGTGTVAIRASGNVTSITDNGVGLYTVNFTTAMPDINYSPVVVASPIYAGGSSFVNLYSNSATTEVAPTTSAFNLRCGYSSSGVTEDLKYVCVAIFR